MKHLILAASALLLAAPATAQSSQDQLDERYNRALAAGYKALFLCSAIANAEANGASRTPESVHEWELTGIQAPLDLIVRDLPYEILRRPTGQVAEVQVPWSEDMPPRIAIYYGEQTGCSVLPLGAPAGASNPGEAVEMSQAEEAGKRTVIGTLVRSGTAEARKPKSRPLDNVLKAATDGGYGTDRTTVVLVRAGEGTYLDGRTLKQAVRSAPGFSQNTPQRTWSVAKSLAATVVGSAVYRGEADVSASAGLGVDEGDPRRAITIDNALRMASGRYQDTPGNRTDPLYWGGTTVDERAQNWPLVHAPGTIYRYANNDTLAAVKAVEGTFVTHPPAELFQMLGMTHTVAETDWQGNYILSSQVWTTARDLGLFGQLYLNDGVLPDGTRILPEGWVEYVSSPSGPQPDGPFGYGAGFWLMNKSDGVPPDTFAAFGNRGQYVVIVPSRNVVIVRRGEDPVGSRFDIAAFTRDVLAALDAQSN